MSQIRTFPVLQEFADPAFIRAYPVERRVMLVDWLRANPNNHNQRTWMTVSDQTDSIDCGTTACAAGATCLLMGRLIVWDELGQPVEVISPSNPNEVRTIMRDAADALALTGLQANDIFGIATTLDGVAAGLAAVTEDPGIEEDNLVDIIWAAQESSMTAARLAAGLTR